MYFVSWHPRIRRLAVVRVSQIRPVSMESRDCRAVTASSACFAIMVPNPSALGDAGFNAHLHQERGGRQGDEYRYDGLGRGAERARQKRRRGDD